MIGTREMLIAMPPCGDDIYRMHQQVWSVVAPHTRGRNAFLYAFEAPGVVRVRSRDLPSGCDRVVPVEGHATIDLVAVEGHDQSRALAHERMAPWVASHVLDAGLDIVGALDLSLSMARGRKLDRHSGRTHHIRLPVVQARFKYRIVDNRLAARALHEGIGRNRRFGFGMLRV